MTDLPQSSFSFPFFFLTMITQKISIPRFSFSKFDNLKLHLSKTSYSELPLLYGKCLTIVRFESS